MAQRPESLPRRRQADQWEVSLARSKFWRSLASRANCTNRTERIPEIIESDGNIVRGWARADLGITCSIVRGWARVTLSITHSTRPKRSFDQYSYAYLLICQNRPKKKHVGGCASLIDGTRHAFTDLASTPKLHTRQRWNWIKPHIYSSTFYFLTFFVMGANKYSEHSVKDTLER